MLQHLFIQLSLYYLTKDIFKLLTLKLVAVAYEMWSFTTVSKCSDLSWKLLVSQFWKTGRLREVVATGGSTVLQYIHGSLR